MINEDLIPLFDTFVAEAAKKYGVNFYQIKGKSRRSKILKARNYAINKMLMNTDATFTACGEYLGNRTPATILHAFRNQYY